MDNPTYTEPIKPNPKPVRLFYFWSGIIATLAYRIIIVLNFYSPVWVQVSWYIGTVGFIIFFWHRYTIDKKRSDLVEDMKLEQLAASVDTADAKQKEALVYIIKTTKTSKSKWNSFFIFGLSVLALIVGIIFDIIAFNS